MHQPTGQRNLDVTDCRNSLHSEMSLVCLKHGLLKKSAKAINADMDLNLWKRDVCF